MKCSRAFYLFYVVLSCVLAPSISAQMIIASDGGSTFTIVVPDEAPASLQNAAQELQKGIELATGAKLPLKKDNMPISTSVISLGSTRQAEAAGLSSAKMAEESFRIVTQNGDLYIIGPDTPDGSWTAKNGVSNGTANGVYTFLEDYLDVRWLMPGELGRDIPARSTFALGKVDRTVTPRFSMRRLTRLTRYANATQRKSIEDWSERHKTGERAGATNFSINFGYNWWATINLSGGWKQGRDSARNTDINTPQIRDFYQKHPEWFAMNQSGKRPYPRTHSDKLETTNPKLVEWFARQAIKTFETSERPTPFSLSPSDYENWSQSPESKALYDPTPEGSSSPGTSSLMTKWYHDIAQLAAREAPQQMLTGFLYASYIYPPTKYHEKLPSNFTPTLVPLRNYGYALHRGDIQKYFQEITNGWAKIVTGDWFYYDLPNQLLRQKITEVGGMDVNFPGSAGLVAPAAPDILNFIFPQLLKNRISGAHLYGVESWSSAALTNYILAKMQWDPTLDARTVQREWLHRAYGEQAGPVMEQFYARLDGWFRDAYRYNKDAHYELTLEMFKDFYGAQRYSEMEKLFLQAKNQTMTAIQQKRLQLIEDNLIVLQWRLRNTGVLPEGFTSPLQRSDAQISAIVVKESPDFPLFPGVVNPTADPVALSKPPVPIPWKVLLSKDGAQPEGANSPIQWKDGQFLIYAAQDSDIQITTQTVANNLYFAAYEVRDQKGELVASGILNTATPIIFPAKAGESYMLTTLPRKTVEFRLKVQNAAVATGDLREGTLVLTGKPAPIYVFYEPGKAFIGAFDNEEGVIIRTSYSGDITREHIASNWKNARSYPLDDGWKFAPDPENDGIARGVFTADFDDSSWPSISPLDWWQMQGQEYYGPAWYRVKFDAPPLTQEETAQLYFGGIDGTATVYLNGKRIGEHLLGPDYQGWNEAFTMELAPYLQSGENLLTVQVISKPIGSSGIFKGAALMIGKLK